MLLIRQGGLGDLLAVLPSLHYLRGVFPACRLTLVCREGYGSLFQRAGLVDGLESESGSRFSRLFLGPGSKDAGTKAWLRGRDLILGWANGGTGRSLEQTVQGYGLPVRILIYDQGQKLTVSRYFYESTVRHFASCTASGPPFEDCIRLPIKNEMRRDGRALAEKAGIGQGRRFAVIHPGAGSLFKRWPLENFLAGAELLSRYGIPGLLITGEAEAEMEKEISTINLPRSWAWLSRPGLASLAGLLAESSLYLGNDSGVTHLAAACGTEVLAVFRKEFEAAWKPNGRVHVFTAVEPASIPVDEVLSAARELINN